MRKKITISLQIIIAFILSFSGLSYLSNKVSADGEDITAPSSLTTTFGATSQLDGIIISATGNPTLSVRLFVSSGEIWLSTTTGLTINDEVEGTLEITGSLSDINTGLATLSYFSATSSSDNLEISLTSPGEIFDPVNSHLYEFVSVPEGISWDDAKVAAESRVKYGLTGYLVTITSAHENDFITDRMLVDGWIGANDVAADGDWKWVTGPEAGTSFWSGETIYDGGVPVGDEYNNWLDIEPNNWGGDEDCGQFYAQDNGGIRGTWNDLSCGDTGITGYLVEYGDNENPAEVINEVIPIANNPVNDNVSTCEELMALDDGEESNKYHNITLTADIDCDDVEVSPLFPDGYHGTFNGQNHKISGYELTTTNSNAALFGRTYNATLKNVHLIDGSIITNNAYAGALIGNADNTSVENVSSTWDISGSQFVGGLIGSMFANEENSISIKKSSTTGNIAATDNAVGGLIGNIFCRDSEILIEQSFATGNLSTTSTTYDYGGLIGKIEAVTQDGDASTVTVQDTYSTGNITASNVTAAGGLVGVLDTDSDNAYDPHITIQRSYASGSLNILENGGGLIGTIGFSSDERYSILNTFAAGQITTSNPTTAGGIVGITISGPTGTISTNNFYDATNSETGGCAGSDGGSIDNCTAINTTSQPNYFKYNHTNQPMATWNFSTIWFVQYNTYPKFTEFDDNDGISKTVEDAGPNDGDANNDGIADRDQNSVTTFLNSQTGDYTTLESTCATDEASITPESSNAKQDAAFNYPFGLMNFRLDCGVQGLTSEVELYFYTDVDSELLRARKYFTTTQSYLALEDAIIDHLTIDGRNVVRISYSITDGGGLDQDGLANGIIVDPVGAALNAAGSPNTGLGFGSR